jgi:glycosyltransferase involved in cell wall biosynthesis
MNILYVVHQFYPESHSGTEKFLLNLSSAIQRDGHFAQIATYTMSEREKEFQRSQNILVKEYHYKGLPVVSIRHRTLPIDINASIANQEIYQFAAEYLQKGKAIDIVHIVHPMRLASFTKAALDLKIPYILTLTDFWMICPRILLQTSSGMLCAGPEGGEACAKFCPDFQPSFIKGRLEEAKSILSGAKAVVSPSRFLASIFKKELPEQKIQIIPHGMNLKHLQTNSRTYGSDDKIIFSYCGGFSPHKGIHILLKAFLDLDPKNAELKLCGTSSHEYDYFHHLQKLAGQDKRIHFCGAYSEEQTGEIMSSTDILVLPSVCYENYPLSLHEALACNVPVIASNIGGMAEKITDSVNGFTFQVGDEKDLAAKLKRILDNPEILNDLKDKMEEYLPPLIEEEAYRYQRLYTTIAAKNAREREY